MVSVRAPLLVYFKLLCAPRRVVVASLFVCISTCTCTCMFTVYRAHFYFARIRPFWLSPRQAIVLPIAPAHNEYAERVRKQLFEQGFQVDVELDPGLTINKKVRNAQLAQYNFILVVGEKEMTNESVNVRTRDNKVHGECTLADLAGKFSKFRDERVLNAEELF